jgi:hypothetical protein
MTNNHFHAYRIRRSDACDIRISRNGIRWEKIEVTKISSAWLEFYSASGFVINEYIRLSVCIHGKLSEFCFKLDSHIVSKKPFRNKTLYILTFDSVTMMERTHLEEIFKGQANDFEPDQSDDNPELTFRMLT